MRPNTPSFAFACSFLAAAVSITSQATTLPPIPPSSASGGEAWRINCGGPSDHVDSDGNLWMKDELFAELKRWGRHNGNAGKAPDADAQPALDRVFSTHGWGDTNFAYRIAVPEGSYRISLLFAETHMTEPGQRVFDVAIENGSVLTNFDICREAGFRTPVRRTFVRRVDDGTLDITFPRIQNDQALLSGVEVEVISVSDDAFLDFVQRALFRLFWENGDPATGLTPWGDYNFESPRADVASIAGAGMGISAYTIAAERRWVDPGEAYKRVANAVDAFDRVLENIQGFWYHYVDVRNGVRRDNSELSNIDSAIAMFGLIQAGEYYRKTHPELTKQVDGIYRRMDWSWWLDRIRPGTDKESERSFINMGWRPEYQDGTPHGFVITNTGPEQGFFVNDWWNRYCESPVINILAIGSPTHPVDPAVWHDMTRVKVTSFGIDFIQEPPLFTHHYQHLWMNLKGLDDGHADYWENTKRATIVNRLTCESDPQKRYEADLWGLTGCDGLYGGYQPYGSEPGGGHDGTVAPSAPMSSTEFLPKECIAATRKMFFQYKHAVWGRFGFCDSFNAPKGWRSPFANSLNNGASILAIENHRSGLVRNTAMKNPHVRRGIERVFGKAE